MAEVHGFAGPRSPCPNCGATQRLSGYADETIRNHRYGIAVLITCGCRHGHLRQVGRSLLLPGQRRLHFAKEQDRRRRTILSVIASLPVSAVYAAERGDSLDTRSACWHALVPTLLAANISELVIERLDGVKARDERDVGDALWKADMVGALGYRHETHRAEPIPWLADAVAWATGAKGDWQRRVACILRAQR
ncbi:MAG: hypothetical protein ACRDTH_17955 [Pseudonocardiaceae bacterium]